MIGHFYIHQAFITETLGPAVKQNLWDRVNLALLHSCYFNSIIQLYELIQLPSLDD